MSPRWMKERGLSLSDFTWNADQRVAFVSVGDRADQCMTGTAVMVYERSFSPGRERVCFDSCHQLDISGIQRKLEGDILELGHTRHAEFAEEAASAHRHNPLAAVAQLDDGVWVEMVVVTAINFVSASELTCGKPEPGRHA